MSDILSIIFQDNAEFGQKCIVGQPPRCFVNGKPLEIDNYLTWFKLK